MITIVLTYYNSGQMLERHLQEWESYAPRVKDNFRAVIVDDGSPTDPAINHMQEVGFPVDLYRIKENIPWNVPGARNLGMDRAPDGFCLLTDIDHMLEADQAAALMSEAELNVDMPKKILRETYFVFSRRWADGRALHPHPNSYLLQREVYWRIGGCDESFSGYWGADEQGFRRRLHEVASGVHLKNIYLTHFGRDDIPDASTREWGRRGSQWDYNNNPVLKAKARGPAYKPVNPLRFSWEQIQWRYREKIGWK